MSMSSFLSKLCMLLIWITSEECFWTGDTQVWYDFWVVPCIIMYTFPNKTKQNNQNNSLHSLSREGITLSIAFMLFSPATSTKSLFIFYFLSMFFWLSDLTHCAHYYITHGNVLRILLLGRQCEYWQAGSKKQNKIFNFSHINFYS